MIDYLGPFFLVTTIYCIALIILLSAGGCSADVRRSVPYYLISLFGLYSLCGFLVAIT